MNGRMTLVALVFLAGAVAGLAGHYRTGWWLLLAAFGGLRLLGLLPQRQQGDTRPVSTRIYLALDLARTDGKGVNADTLTEVLEEELLDTLDVDGSTYDVRVLGIGTSMPAMQESMRLRRAPL